MIAGRIPPHPIAVLVYLELLSASRGTAVFTCSPDESVYNPIGAVHGRFAFAEGVVTDSEGRIVATASSTPLLFEAWGRGEVEHSMAVGRRPIRPSDARRQRNGDGVSVAALRLSRCQFRR
jgi:hypothetical protein